MLRFLYKRHSQWFGWCEYCGKRRLRVYWWVRAGVHYDTWCMRCHPRYRFVRRKAWL